MAVTIEIPTAFSASASLRITIELRRSSVKRLNAVGIQSSLPCRLQSCDVLDAISKTTKPWRLGVLCLDSRQLPSK